MMVNHDWSEPAWRFLKLVKWINWVMWTLVRMVMSEQSILGCPCSAPRCSGASWRPPRPRWELISVRIQRFKRMVVQSYLRWFQRFIDNDEPPTPTSYFCVANISSAIDLWMQMRSTIDAWLDDNGLSVVSKMSGPAKLVTPFVSSQWFTISCDQ